MSNLKSFIVFLSRNKLYTFINILGLSTSLMFVILITNYLVTEFTIDKFHEKLDNIYVASTETGSPTAYYVGHHLETQFPEVVRTCGYYNMDNLSVEVDGKKQTSTITGVDSTFLDIFSFKLIDGNRNEVLKTKDKALISESYARKVFGSENPIGAQLTVRSGERNFIVTVDGIIEDFTNTMLKPTDVIVRFENIGNFNPSLVSEFMNNAGSVTVFIETVKGSDITLKEQDAVDYFKTCFWIYENGLSNVMQFIKLDDLYFSTDIDAGRDLNQNDRMILIVLSFVAILILLFAVFNYINLTTAQCAARAKEVATRKLYGASPISVYLKMIFEASLLCSISFITGFIMAVSFENYISGLVGRELDVLGGMNPTSVSLYLLLIILLSIATGIVPALTLSRTRPIDVIKGSFTFKSKMVYSKIFIMIQSGITIFLIACSITIYKQVEYMINYDVGYKTTGIIEIGMINEMRNREGEIRSTLSQLPRVNSVGFVKGTPINGGNNQTMTVKDINNMISFQIIELDSAAFNILGLRKIQENNWGEEGYYTTPQTLGMLESDRSLLSFKSENNNDEYKIAGIIEDFLLYDVAQDRGSRSGLLMKLKEDINPWSFLIEVNGDKQESYQIVHDAISEIVDGAFFNAKYIEDMYYEAYQPQRSIQSLMLLFSFISIIISSLGLLAMSIYFIQQRSREIAVRKVFGSSNIEVLMKIVWQYISIVLITFIFAAPLTWYAMTKWLEGFSYRIDMSISYILLAGLLNLIIAFITVYWQSKKAATANPVETIKR